MLVFTQEFFRYFDFFILVWYKMTCDPLKEKSLRISWLQLFKEVWVPTTRWLDTSYTESKTACFLLGKDD